MDETYDVVVVGAGLAGFTAAAAERVGEGRSVLVVDRQPVGFGGRAATDQVGRFRFNRGCHALYRSTPGRPVLQRLGVEVATHPPPIEGGQGRLGDRLGLLPLDALSLERTDLLTARDKQGLGQVLSGMRRWRPTELAEMTVDEWFDDLGLDGAVRQMCEMLCRLTGYVADLDVMSADVAAMQIQAGLTGGVDYPDQGWSSLIYGIAATGRRRGVEALGGARVRAVTPEGGRVRIDVGGGQLLARQVILAAGPPEANAALLPETPAPWEQLVPPVRAACFDLGLATRPTSKYVIGIDRPLYLSQHGPPGAMAPEGGAMYQTLRYLRADEDPPAEQARAELAEHCRLSGFDPDEAEESRYLHRMVVCGGLPTPSMGGMAGRPPVATGLDGVMVAGDWVGPAGHLADAALVSGELAGWTAAKALDSGTTGRTPA